MKIELKKGMRIMIDLSEFDSAPGYGIERRSICKVDRDGIPSCKVNRYEIKIPLGSIRRVMFKGNNVETPFGVGYNG